MSGHVPYMWLGGVLAIMAVVVVVVETCRGRSSSRRACDCLAL